jgi:hypothetical protein
LVYFKKPFSALKCAAKVGAVADSNTFIEMQPSPETPEQFSELLSDNSQLNYSSPIPNPLAAY